MIRLANLSRIFRRKKEVSGDFPPLTLDINLAKTAQDMASFCWCFGARVTARGHRYVDGVDKGRVLQQSVYREYLDAQKVMLDHFPHLVSPKAVRYFLVVAGYYLHSHEYEDGPLGLARYMETMLRVAPLYWDMPESKVSNRRSSDLIPTPDDHARNALEYCELLEQNYGYGDGIHILKSALGIDVDIPNGF